MRFPFWSAYSEYRKQTKQWLDHGAFKFYFQTLYTLLLIALLVMYFTVDCFIFI
jgi:hypothetical protein